MYIGYSRPVVTLLPKYLHIGLQTNIANMMPRGEELKALPVHDSLLLQQDKRVHRIKTIG